MCQKRRDATKATLGLAPLLTMAQKNNSFAFNLVFVLAFFEKGRWIIFGFLKLFVLAEGQESKCRCKEIEFLFGFGRIHHAAHDGCQKQGTHEAVNQPCRKENQHLRQAHQGTNKTHGDESNKFKEMTVWQKAKVENGLL
jgi:hypothetical protein